MANTKRFWKENKMQREQECALKSKQKLIEKEEKSIRIEKQKAERGGQVPRSCCKNVNGKESNKRALIPVSVRRL